MRKILLGFDLATRTGVSRFDEDGGLVMACAWDLKPTRHESQGMRWVKFEASLRRLDESLPQDAFIIFAYEEVRRHVGTSAAHVYGGLVAILQRFCIEKSYDYFGIPVGTIKKAATGKGNANKLAVLDAARSRWGSLIPEGDFDVADAAWVGQTAWNELYPCGATPEDVQRDLFDDARGSK